MEEFDDSLDGGEEFTGPILVTGISNTELQVTNHLISALHNDQHTSQQTEDGMSIQTASYQASASAESHSPSQQNLATNVIYQETGSPGMNVGIHYKRSGPDGSPAFNHSRGFLPTVTDNESVVFKPVKQLDFSALDDTSSRIDSTHVEMSSQGMYPPYMLEQRREVYGSHDLTEDSRGQSPNYQFFAMKSSPVESEGSGVELDSRDIFSPVRTHDDQYTVADGTYSPPSYSGKEHDRRIQEQNQAVSFTQATQNNRLTEFTRDSQFERNTSGQSDDGFVSPQLSRSYSDKSSPRNNSISCSPSKRTVSVSIPYANCVTSPKYDSSPNSQRHREPNTIMENRQLEMGEKHANGPQISASWDVPVSDIVSSQTSQSKDYRLQQKPLGQRKPFVSSVKSDIDSYHPKVHTQLDSTKRETSIPRPKTKGSDQVKLSQENRLVRGETLQRPVTQGQRSGSDDLRQQNFHERKFVGPIPSHAESRIQARKNLSLNNGKMGNKQEHTQRSVNCHVNRSLNSKSQNQQVKGQTGQEINQGAREFHEAARQGLKHQEHSPVHPAANVVTQVQQYSTDRDDHRREHHDNSNEDVKGMEEVRSQLQSMLKFSADITHEGSQGFDHSDHFFETSEENLQLPMDYSIQSGKGKDDVSSLLENFPSFSSHLWSDTSNQNRSESSLVTENSRIKEILEKERYRRKHCEQYIQRLNVKLLETQQQLAVAISTDKRKDIMIEQLDKQLAKVVEGWKKRDEHKEEILSQMRNEKAKIEEKLSKQQEMIQNFEKDMSEAVEQLRKEKEKASMEIEQLQVKASEAERCKCHAEEMLEAEKERGQLIKQEWDHLKETRDHSEKKVQQLQDRIRNEQDDWFKREQELLHKIEEVSEGNQKILQQERVKSEEHITKCKELEEQVHESQTNLRKKDLELDAAIREKESLKVEMSIMEAKFESSQRTLEAELHSHMEKEIAEQIADVHRRMEESESELRVSHREQIKELNQRYTRDMERNMAKFHEDQKNKEEECRKLSLEYEQKLQEQRVEISTLQSTKQKLESQRSEILMKLQYMMQSQWNEAVQLLASTPQRKNIHSSSFSTQGTGGVNVTLGGTSQTGYPITSSPGRDSMGSGHPNIEPPNITDLTTSLHMQQFLQSLSQPISFGASSVPNTIAEVKCSDSTVSLSQSSLNDSHMTVGSQRSGINAPKLSLIPENPSQMDDANITDMDHQIHSWLQTSQGAANKPENNVYSKPQTYHTEKSNAPRQDPGLYTHRSEEFVPSYEDSPPAPQPVAVPIRPPQHGNSQYPCQPMHHLSGALSVNDISIDTVHSANKIPAMEVRSIWSQRSPGHSPPTKQSRSVQDQYSPRDEHEEDVMKETVRLNADYSEISQKLEQHESRQGELQHYIQMLLNKPPGDPVIPVDHDENASLFSNDHTEELDLNDTAQAAQLQRELQRIQELRNKQTKIQEVVKETKEKSSSQRNSNADSSNSKVLQPDQIAEIAKLLHQNREHWDTSHSSQSNQQLDEAQLLQLVYMLKNMPPRQPAGSMGLEGQKPGMPQSPRQAKELAKVKRNLKEQLAGPSDVRSEKGPTKGPQHAQQSQQKKPDRKIAPSGKSAQGKNKNAWK